MRIAIAGANGRMGRMLIEAVLKSSDLQLAVALDHTGADSIGLDAGAFLGQTTGVVITDDLDQLRQADCLIDFTRPAGTLNHLQACITHQCKLVIGTTGFSEAEKQQIAAAAEQTAIVFAPNMSVGVNVALRLIEMAAKLMNQGFDAEVFEAHHRHKVDAPSGTALAMGEAVAKAWDVELNEVADWTRHGETGAREDGRIGFSVVRGGDIIGDHTVFFCGEGERIEITHRSSNRSTYAQGSLRAVRFLAQKDTGLYSMQDVLDA
ncbi:MAG TPA: 4-hydroxy-tetrahydrodipicolinate reductase [Paenalcaligenes hominis]|uniref:4-hydroxy-tetrahydrodipicolinate reductase n=1 Tax=Paenalcaligenes hominis TaxID=643674 RepID=A0A9D2VHK9_9BURK|nr:4-hydroxy-tetrahydrodipicolinate reductase [Paenalcaligenes hominis]NJB66278.1 4-hydroxy-tetrahydrodipicolinate reductase [Paenalcaligenes hominis]GGE74588.1 4-hydroxy-tetrahydrodipicolinate reductase [Paenalcaligenes hominis]HJH24857.1 4-hydroxy-tetrahydrodipicolinate reductase [Paenalcaligenes hominis]